jgi:hypothetical protein
MRHIFASGETAFVAKTNKNKRIEIYSFFPCDRAGCDCQRLIIETRKKLSEMQEKDRIAFMSEKKVLVCPRNKKGLNRYVVECKTCGEVLGYCWAKDATLTDWCDFHYTNWTDGAEWHGCLTPHVSPITQQLCLECCCGEDTRDFRANMTLSAKEASLKEEKNMIGREFDKSDSKFKVRKVMANVLPFKGG